MSNKYIKQQILQNFVYPNNTKDQYDIEIVHDINNNCVSGDINQFSAITASYSAITIQYSFDWDANGAELFQMDDGNYSYISVHLMSPDQDYMKPFVVVEHIESSTLYTGTTTFTGTTTIVPSDLGILQFGNGTYYYEVRMIGHRCLYPICGSFDLSGITPGPTPTPTPTPTVTPTATPIGPTATPTPTPTPSATGTGCECYWLLNETGFQLTYTYTPCGGISDVYLIGAGQSKYLCSEDYPTVDPGITVTICGVSCTEDPCLPCA